VLRYQYARQSDSGLQATGSLANWRCIAVEKRSRVEVLEAHRAQPLPSTDLRGGHGYGRLAGFPGAAERTARQLPEQLAGENNP
jgi:hypothetical protein